MATRSHTIQTPGAPATNPNPQSIPLVGIGEDDVFIDVAGHQIPMNDIVRSAYETSGISLDEWNALGGQERDELLAGKTKEMAQQFREAGDLPRQSEVQKQAQAAAEARRASRKVQANPDSPEAKVAQLPHSKTIDPDTLSAPMQCSDGILVPTPKKPLPHNFR